MYSLSLYISIYLSLSLSLSLYIYIYICMYIALGFLAAGESGGPGSLAVLEEEGFAEDLAA